MQLPLQDIWPTVLLLSHSDLDKGELLLIRLLQTRISTQF